MPTDDSKLMEDFRDRAASLYNWRRLGQIMNRRQSELMENYELTKIDMAILHYLGQAGEQNTARDIIQYGCFSKGHVSQALKKMTNQGYIRQEKDDLDRRLIHVYLTEKAMPVVENGNADHRVIWERLTEGISEEELTAFKTILRKFNRNISGIIREEKIWERRNTERKKENL